MATLTLSRSPLSIASRERFRISRALSLALGLPICLCFFEPSSQGSPAIQQRVGAGVRPIVEVLRDVDGDGLDDVLEAGQYSAADQVDTDVDGWNDAEELARGSLSTAFCSQPNHNSNSIGANAYMRSGKLHVAIAAYIRSGSLENVHVDVGLYSAHMMIQLTPMSYGQHATITTVPTKNPGELLIVTDIIVPMAPLVRTGAMSIFSKMRVENTVCSAAVINLVMHGDIPTALITPAQMSPLAGELLGPGLLHRPLGGTAPASWSSGEVCFQRLESVGTHGAVVTQEVSSAGCISGWDGYCDGGNCASSVGTTVDLVDPAGLIGG
ncbi:MAG TPA: hypothetical protein VK843_07885 [Planctomycetota bacterium]|nr:hypothetical protein [Planctomycetota bacterium]